MGASIELLTVGRTRRGPLLEFEEQLLERIERLATCQRRAVPPSKDRRAGQRRREEGQSLLSKRPSRGMLICLDPEGRSLTSEEFRRRLTDWRARGRVTLVVGGPDGLDESVIEAADAVLSLGPMTLPHELALIVLLEQLYRALAAEAGHPYAFH